VKVRKDGVLETRNVNHVGVTILQTGTKTTIDGTAVAIASTSTVRKVNVRADIANTTSVLVGNSSTQVYPLFPGEAVDVDVDDLATVFIKRSAGANVTINFLAW